MLAIGFAGIAIAEDDDIEKHPGYIDLDDIEIPEASESVADIDLGPDLLRILSKSRGEEGEEDDFAGKILKIRVKSFESDEISTENLQPVIERIESKLKRGDWKQIVKVREDDEQVTVSIKYSDDGILGLFVMAIEDGDEVAFVNVVGDFSFEDLGSIDLDMDEAVLDSLKKSVDK
jgi:hypothetical protein